MHVFPRIRPSCDIPGIENESILKCITVTQTEISYATNERQGSYSFEQVLPETSTQDMVFSAVDEAVNVSGIMRGNNVAVLAYGPTGSGKTRTIFGTPADEGVLPKALRKLLVDPQCPIDDSQDMLLTITMGCINQEMFCDLLDSTHTKDDLRLKENAVEGVYVDGITEVRIRTVENAIQIVEYGRSNLALLEQDACYQLSRMSTIVTVALRQRDTETGALRTKGKLICTDLCGSERMSKQALVGKTLKNATKVGMANCALGNVMRALASPEATHVPYRDSMLTRLLREALGGNCRTVFVFCLLPLLSDAEETLSTLRYCSRAKMIVNHPVTADETTNRELEASSLKKLFATRC